MTITYKGSEPERRVYTSGVQGNNETDTIEFVIPATTSDGIDLTDYTPTILVTSKPPTYVGEIDPADVEADDNGNIVVTLPVPAEITQAGNVYFQIVFADGDDDGARIWQTQIVNVLFHPQIDLDADIVKGYPDKIVDLQNQITAETERATAAEVVLSNTITAETERATQAEDSLAASITDLENQIANIDTGSVEIAAGLTAGTETGTDSLTVTLNNSKGATMSTASVTLPYTKTADVQDIVDSKIKLVDKIDFTDFSVGEYRLLKK